MSTTGRSRIALSAAALLLGIGGAAVGAAIASAGTVPPAGAATNGSGRHANGPPDCSGPKVTVAGTGSVSITPNLLTLSLDVHTTAAQASVALDQNNSVTAAVLHALAAGGIAPSRIQTTDLTIEPNYANTGGRITGYGVDNTVIAKIKKFATAGTVIDAAVAAGGNDARIDSLSFSLTRPLAAQARARTAAVHQAVSHAKAIAASAGEKLGGICSVHDTTGTSTTAPIPPFDSFGKVAAPSARVPVEPGSETVTGHVTIVFALG